MKRWISLLPAAFLLLVTVLALAQDLSDRRASRAALAGGDEPGPRLTVIGTVFQSDGETPAAGVEVFAYHTDIHGYYNDDDRNSARPRLKATVTTDAQGEFRLDTIVPGPYPQQRIPAHIHFVVTDPDGVEHRHDLNFEDDAFLSDAARRRSREAGKFGDIRPHVVDAEGRSTVEINFRL